MPTKQAQQICWVMASILLLIGFYLAYPRGVNPLSFDTISFITLSDFRQPLYGTVVLFLRDIGITDESIKALQLWSHLGCALYLIYEIHKVSWRTAVGSVFIAALIITFWKYGALRYGLGSLVFVGKIIAEGWTYSFIVLLFALLVRFARTGSCVLLPLIALVLVMLGQIKTAANLYLLALAPLTLLIYVLSLAHAKRNIVILLGACLIFAGLLPVMTGKEAFQLGTKQSRMMFAVGPRIAMLKPPTDDFIPQQYRKVNECWQHHAQNLPVLEWSVLNAAVQELVRYELFPKLIAPAYGGITMEEANRQWNEGIDQDDYMGLIRGWIKGDSEAYIGTSLRQAFAMITHASMATSGQQDRLFAVYEKVNACHDRLGVQRLRFDYPMRLDGVRPNTLINAIFISLRLVGGVFCLLAVFSLLRAIKALIQRRQPQPVDLAMLIGATILVANVLPPALLVYAEPRYVFTSLYVIAGTFALVVSLGFKART